MHFSKNPKRAVKGEYGSFENSDYRDILVICTWVLWKFMISFIALSVAFERWAYQLVMLKNSSVILSNFVGIWFSNDVWKDDKVCERIVEIITLIGSFGFTPGLEI